MHYNMTGWCHRSQDRTADHDLSGKVPRVLTNRKVLTRARDLQSRDRRVCLSG